jgi:hypothetical protein
LLQHPQPPFFGGALSQKYISAVATSVAAGGPYPINGMFSAMNSLLLGADSTAARQSFVPALRGKSPSQLVVGAVLEGANDRPAEGNAALDKLLGPSFETIRKLPPADAVKARDQMLAEFAGAKFDFADPINKSKITNFILESMEDPTMGMESLISLLPKSVNTIMDITPGGLVLFLGPEADAYNERFGRYINNAIKAYANVHNVSVAEATKDFLPRVINQTSTLAIAFDEDPDFKALPGMPTKSPVEAPRSPEKALSKDRSLD